MGRRIVTAVLALALTTLLPSPPAGAASPTVAAGLVTAQEDGLCSLSEAIDNANDDEVTHRDCPAGRGADVITLPAATYPLGGFARSRATAFDITSDITIIGASAVSRVGGSVTVLDGGDMIRHFRVHPDASLTLQDLRLVRGLASETDGVPGWAWWYWWGPDGGGAVDNLGVLTTLRVAFVDNHSTTVGGAVRNTCERLTYRGQPWSEEERCSSAPPWSPTPSPAGVLLADATSFEGNTAAYSGGAIANQGASSEAHITGSTLTGNRAPDGAAISTGNRASIADSSITSNVAQYDDDDAFDDKAIIHNVGELTISRSTIARNTGISAITNYTDGDLYMRQVAVADNRARGITNVSADWVGATVDIEDSAVTGNVGFVAGGILNHPNDYCDVKSCAPRMRVRDSTVSGNRALGSLNHGSRSGPTGGIRSLYGRLNLMGVTIVRNSSGDEDDAQLLTTAEGSEFGGGGWGFAISNTVVADPVRGTNCFVQYTVSSNWHSSHNMTDDATCPSEGFTQVGDVLLAPLGDYGGPTLSHVPHPASPVLHAGDQDECDDRKHGTDPDEPVTDQRGAGFLRTAGPACDIGAVEADNVTLTSVLSVDVGQLRFASGPPDGNEGLRASLQAKLEAAGDATRRGNDNAAVGQLRAFAEQVDAHRGRRVAEPDAERLVTGARAVRDLLLCCGTARR